MRLTVFRILFVMVILSLVPLCNIFGDPSTGTSEPIISALDKSVNRMDTDLRVYARKLNPGDNAKLVGLLDKQRRQLDEVKAKYQKVRFSSAGQNLAKDLEGFFKTGGEIQRLLKSSQGAFQAQGYSADPSQCANHCSNSCGYNSVGEKVCWYSCYYCCGRGGC